MKKVMISTIYKGKVVKAAITKLSPIKLVLLIDKPIEKTKKAAVDYLKQHFRDVIQIETLATSVYEMPKIISDVVKKIDEEAKQENEIIVHVSEGRKITSLALLFAAYLRKDKIKGAYYIIEETNEVLTLPLINFSLGGSKKKLLQEVEKGNGKIEKLLKKLQIKQSAIYQHIQELKKEGYLESNKEFKLTDLGRIMIL